MPMTNLLDEIGFQPELTPDGTAILLHHCPFHELARDRPEIVCNIHLGLLRGHCGSSTRPPRPPA